MFTGLVSDVGRITAIEQRGDVRRVWIASGYPAESIALGASIACSGPCLTAVAVERQGNGSSFAVELGAETLARTTAHAWRIGDRLNLERSLKVGDELGGHFVSGHVDGVAEIARVERGENSTQFVLAAPDELSRFIATKGSVTLDGTSLTVNSVDGRHFSILLIPHTLAVTTWRDRRAGDFVNLEVDLMARYARRLLETAQ